MFGNRKLHFLFYAFLVSLPACARVHICISIFLRGTGKTSGLSNCYVMSIRFRFTPPLPLKRTSWWKKSWERQVSEKSCLSNCERGHSPKLHQAIGLRSSFQFSEVKFVGPNLLVDAHAMTRRSRKIARVRFRVFRGGAICPETSTSWIFLPYSEVFKNALEV